MSAYEGTKSNTETALPQATGTRNPSRNAGSKPLQVLAAFGEAEERCILWNTGFQTSLTTIHSKKHIHITTLYIHLCVSLTQNSPCDSTESYQVYCAVIFHFIPFFFLNCGSQPT